MAESKKFKKPETLRVVQAIGRVTFLEIIRDKVLYNVLVIALLLFGVGYLAAQMTFIRPDRVILDFGMSAINLSCAFISILAGANLLGREFERRTIFVALSHPISRSQFILGKFAGLAAVLFLNWLLLSVAFLGVLALTSLDFFANLSAALFLGVCLMYLQSLVLASIAVLFSTISTTSISIMITVGLYLVGNNISQIRFVAAQVQTPVSAFLLKLTANLLPNLEYFNLGTKVSYGLPVTWSLALTSIAYGISVVAVFMALSGLLIRGREV